MADEVPSGDKAVLAVFEMFALAFAFEGTSSLLSGRGEYLRVVLAYSAALGLFIFGLRWPSIRRRMANPVVSKIHEVANDYRYRISALVLISFSIVTILFVYLRAIRNDLDAYAMPRVVTEKQASRLREYLSSRSPHPVIVQSVDTREAQEYAGQIWAVLRATKWDVNPPNHNGPWHVSSANDGLGIFAIRGTAKPYTSPDPNNPDAETILKDSFEFAGIPVSTGGSVAVIGGPNDDAGAVTVIVGRRPLSIRNSESVSRKIGEWLVER
jgi:hypothetical protein